jgi:hypothetical protein
MKVLKSGVEMTPEEMQKNRGGACACGCGVGRDADSAWNGSNLGTNCYCNCDPYDPESQEDMGDSAFKYLF